LFYFFFDFIEKGRQCIYREGGIDKLILLLVEEKEEVIEYATVKVIASFYRQGNFLTLTLVFFNPNLTLSLENYFLNKK
jgi:hypothetical protein